MTIHCRPVVNWAEVGALAGVAALVEAPSLLAITWGFRWVKETNERLTRMEQRSWNRRHTDPPHRSPPPDL